MPYLPPLLGDDLPANKEIKQISRAFSAFILSKKFNLSEKEACNFVVDDYDGIESNMLLPFPEACAELSRNIVKGSLEVVPLLASTGSANDKQKHRFDPLSIQDYQKDLLRSHMRE